MEQIKQLYIAYCRGFEDNNYIELPRADWEQFFKRMKFRQFLTDMHSDIAVSKITDDVLDDWTIYYLSLRGFVQDDQSPTT